MNTFDIFLKDAVDDIQKLQTRVVRAFTERIHQFVLEVMGRINSWKAQKQKLSEEVESKRIVLMQQWIGQLLEVEWSMKNYDLSLENEPPQPQQTYKEPSVVVTQEHKSIFDKLQPQPQSNYCEKCDQTFRCIRSHITQIHSQSNPSRCPICRRVFEEEYDLAKHLLEKHAKVNSRGIKKFVCPFSGQVFAKKRHYSELRTYIQQTKEYNQIQSTDRRITKELFND